MNSRRTARRQRLAAAGRRVGARLRSAAWTPGSPPSRASSASSSAPARCWRSTSASASSGGCVDAESPPACCRPGSPTSWRVLRSSAVVLDVDDRVVRCQPGRATPWGWSAADRLVVRGAARAGPADAPGRRDPGAAAGAAARAARQRHVRRAGPGRAARVRPRPAARRGPHRGPPGRGGPARLRRQRQPRAQDAGRRDGAARRGAGGRGGRPGGRTPLRRPDAARERAAQPGWCRTSSSCPGCRATTRSRRRPWCALDDVVAEAVDRSRATAEARRHHPGLRRPSRRQGVAATPASWSPRWATWSTTPCATRRRGRRVSVAERRRRVRRPRSPS